MSIKSLKLIWILIFRNIKEEKLFSLLSIIGIALGIGLYISVQTATDKAISAFSTDISKLNPYTNAELTPNFGIYLDEQLYAKLLKNHEEVFPVLLTKAFDKSTTQNINIYGIDVLKTWNTVKPKVNISSMNLSFFFTKTNSILAPASFASQKNLNVGDLFYLSAFDKEYPFTLTAIYDEKELNFDGLLMDIANFQDLFGLQGKLSWIDLKSDNPESLLPLLPDSVTLQSKISVIQQKEQIIMSFKHNLQFISFIAILVGFFLLFNTVFISIVKKRTQIGILRSLGMKTIEILMIFVGFGMFLGSIGTIVGIGLGQLLTGITMSMTEKTVSNIYAMVKLSSDGLQAEYVIKAIIIGMIISFAASIVPAMEAAKIKPNETSREGSFENRYKRYYKPLSFAGILIILIGILSVFIDYRQATSGTPIYSYIGILLIIIGFSITAPYYLQLITTGISKSLSPLKSPALIMANGNITGSLSRFSIALVSIAISTSLIVSMFVLIHSFRTSFKGWINHTLVADIYVKPESCISNFCFEPLSREILLKIKAQPEVENVNPFSVMKGIADNEHFLFGFGDKEVLKTYYNNKVFHTNKNMVSITEQVSSKLNKSLGENILVKTPSGSHSFEIGEIFTSYSTTQGLILFDKSYLKELWQMDHENQISIFLKPDTNIDDFAKKLEQNILKDYSLELLTNHEIRNKVLNIFDKSFAMTYAIQLIAFIVSLIGIINTLTAIVIEHQREISVLRYIGARFRLIKQIYIWSTAITGLSGIIMGTAIGAILSVILVKVINAISFGWTIYFNIPVASLFIILSILLILIVLSGMLPITLIRKIDPKKYISFE